jgi:hypothetical protein
MSKAESLWKQGVASPNCGVSCYHHQSMVMCNAHLLINNVLHRGLLRRKKLTDAFSGSPCQSAAKPSGLMIMSAAGAPGFPSEIGWPPSQPRHTLLSTGALRPACRIPHHCRRAST